MLERRNKTSRPSPKNFFKYFTSSLPLNFLLLGTLFLAIAIAGVRSLPSLYGDEYYSILEAKNLGTNIHAIGYSLQLALWSYLEDTDPWLRVLSLTWAAVGLYWFHRWLVSAGLPLNTCRFAVLLLTLNPFFWQYATQVRFYSFFFACTLLSSWRYTEWKNRPDRRNVVLMVLALILTLTSHLFGWLVVGSIAVLTLHAHARRLTWALVISAAAIGLILLLVPGTLQTIVSLVYLLTNPYASIPEAHPRGISLAMIAKIPLTLFFFSSGERLYPLLLWPVVPIMLVVAISGVLGVIRLRQYPDLFAWFLLYLIVMAAMYLVFDPLAPVGLQGAAPRYLIFMLPAFWAVLALGAQFSHLLKGSLIATQAVALTFFLFPSWSNGLFGYSTWSYGQLDMANWRTYLNTATVSPAARCIIVDGRGRAPVERYAPQNSVITHDYRDCLEYDTVLLVSNDHRLDQVRWMDDVSRNLIGEYTLISNFAQFPAQVTVYQRVSGQKQRSQDGKGFSVSRLDLPEQDLQLPLSTQLNTSMSTVHTLSGFIRLDAQQKGITLPAPSGHIEYVFTNYLSTKPLAPGTPILSLQWIGTNGQSEDMIVRADIETATWDGQCSKCLTAATWQKRLALVGARGYPDAYKEYSASIWATELTQPDFPVKSLVINSLIDEGTVYFWGFYSRPTHISTKAATDHRQESAH